MSHNLKRSLLAILAVGGVFLAVLVLLVSLMEFSWMISAAGKRFEYDRVLRFGFEAYLLIVWSGIIPCFVLQTQRVRFLGAYLIAGVASGLVYTWCLLFAMKHGLPLAFCCIGQKPIDELMIELFRGMPRLLSEFIVTNDGIEPLLFLTVPGFLVSGLYWLLFARRIRRAASLSQ